MPRIGAALVLLLTTAVLEHPALTFSPRRRAGRPDELHRPHQPVLLHAPDQADTFRGIVMPVRLHNGTTPPTP
ncbi:hypothetical protein [Streptomyces massasporeus]|uniref:hypothetical protein n=1 Tax=Streptomyces massasporeus TaxID=67324 RepID=UPI00371F2EA3